MASPSPQHVLLTGATGYIGGRLLQQLQRRKIKLSCLARQPENLLSRHPNAHVIKGDVLEPESLLQALSGVDTAYYLVHSMGAKKDFERLDAQAAENFGQAAQSAGVRRIIYLGGLGKDEQNLSPHLRSRQHVGQVLSGYVPVVELRTSIVIGSGSLSFEMIRSLTERLPLMITPRWVHVKTQPIAISDLLEYLIQALYLPPACSGIFEIGGADQVSYGDLMWEYAQQRGLKRYKIPVPVITPHLSSLWLGLVTPVYARIGRKLVDSLNNPTVITDHTADSWFDIEPMGMQKAMSLALKNEEQDLAATRWSDALSSSGSLPVWGGIRFGNRLIDMRSRDINTTADKAFAPIRRIGGRTGWYYATWLWKLRGFLDLLVGGVGVRRGRRHPEKLRVGDTVDWWRVEAVSERRLLLRAEMKLPGRAWLEFNVTSKDEKTLIQQTAIFDPIGLGGLLYWYSVYPLHALVFRGMLREIARAAEQE
ncbi:MAG: SDR family oxidoreductase [candidate division KSB1 bacterium]|nr:SDR family oxidoreductase [candidate division KSB1 bacterium]